MNSRNKLIVVCVICAAVALLSVGGGVFAYQKYASTFNNASNGNVSLNSINEGMSYTILDDGTNVYENPDKGSAVLMQTKANETVSFLALAHGGFYKIRVNGVDGYVLCDKVVDTTLATPAPTENPTTVIYIVNVNESVTLRKTPDQNGEQITTIPLGTQVEFVKKENDDFSKIKYGGQEGFVMTKYLTEDANIAIQQAGNKNAKPAEPVQHATGSSDVSVKFTMYVFNVQNSIYLRKYAEENSENICTIPWGEPVGYIEDVTNGFYKIKYKGQIGYAKAEYLTSTDPHVYTGGNPIYHISGVQNSVYLRKTPSEPAEYICEIPVGAAVEYLGSYNGYDKVNYNGMVGYVTSAYVR